MKIQLRALPLFFVLLLSHHSYVLADFVYGVFYSTVYEIDTASNTVTDVIGVGGQSLAITPDGSFIYVTTPSNNTVSVINRCSKTVIASIPVGRTPDGIAITPNGKFAYVANVSDWTVSVIDLATNKVVGTPINVQSLPHSIAITPDGRFAYVGNSLTASISVIDIATNTVTSTIPFTTALDEIAITPDGQSAYIVHGLSGIISVLDIATNTVVATIPGFNRPGKIAITPNGLFAYVANGSNVAVISTVSNSIVKTIPTTVAYLDAITVTPDGLKVYVGSSSSGTAFAINTATNTIQNSILAFQSTDMATTSSNFTLKATSNPVNPTICSGKWINMNLSANMANATFAWTVVQTNVSGASNSAGSILAQQLTATSNVPGTAVYTVRPSAKGCAGTIYKGDPLIITVTVNPIPVATATPSQSTIVSGSLTNIELTSNVLKTNFTWSVVQNNVTGASAGSGTSIKQALTAKNNTPGTVTYNITPTANNCAGTPIQVVVTVNPS